MYRRFRLNDLVVPFVLVCSVVWSGARAEVTQVDNAKLAELIEAGVPVVDIRTPEEWRTTGVVEGSHLLTFFGRNGQYDAKAWLTEFRKIAGPDDPVILICETGGRTGVVSRFLDTRAGFNGIHDVSRGIRAWIDASRPTVRVSR